MSIEQVRHFNNTFGVPMSSTPTTRVPAAGLRYELIREELEELGDAIDALDIVEIADALGDIEYVGHGAILVFGLSGAAHSKRSSTSYSLGYAAGRQLALDDLRSAILWNNAQGAVDTLLDLVSSVRSYAESFGIDLDLIVDAIHKSNMSKLGEDGKPIYREGDGKVLKGPDYKTPTEDIRKLVFGDNYAPASK